MVDHTSYDQMYGTWHFGTGYTCDYVDSDGGAYPAVRSALNQLGSFEDIIAAGACQAKGAAVAVLYSVSQQ
jgi:hypothetical protein